MFLYCSGIELNIDIKKISSVVEQKRGRVEVRRLLLCY